MLSLSRHMSEKWDLTTASRSITQSTALLFLPEKKILLIGNKSVLTLATEISIKLLPEISEHNPGALFRTSLSNNIDFLNSAPRLCSEISGT